MGGEKLLDGKYLPAFDLPCKVCNAEAARAKQLPYFISVCQPVKQRQRVGLFPALFLFFKAESARRAALLHTYFFEASRANHGAFLRFRIKQVLRFLRRTRFQLSILNYNIRVSYVYLVAAVQGTGSVQLDAVDKRSVCRAVIRGDKPSVNGSENKMA